MRSRVSKVLFASLVSIAVVVVGGVPPSNVAAANATTPPYETYTGSVAGFYHVPDPLPSGSPGQLIRVQAVATTSTSTTMRIMYHSIDGAGRDRAVTGTITYPNATAPQSGWPVLSIANGTVGLGPQCAISRSNTGVFGFGVNGVAVDSDYIGEGPIGQVQAYLSRESEAHSVLDAVRAARNLQAAHAGSRFVVLGGSQGGHGALSTNELAATYAPELDLLGTVALAPAAMFDRTYGPLDEIVTRVVTAMGVVGLATEHPEIDLSDYVGPAGLAAIAQMRTECTSDIISTVLGVPGGFFTHDPRSTEPARSIMLANDVGNVAAASPVLLIQGTADTTVTPQRTADLFTRMCGVGQVTDFLSVPGATHEDVTQMALTPIESWLAARLAGHTAPDSCLRTTPSTTTAAPSTTLAAPATTPATSMSSSAPASVGATSSSQAGGPGTGRSPVSAATTGTLPATGSRIAPLAMISVTCVLLGVALITGRRRRARR
ncbi:MAG: hypothetical protein JST73_04890 [Actinobacteria bacterium]|nr:hypothetical protein [Actinomycetota bacterium]